jgi:membrane-associated phospholipid phosphatase
MRGGDASTDAEDCEAIRMDGSHAASGRRRLTLSAVLLCVLLAIFAAVAGCTTAGISLDRSVLQTLSRPVGTSSWRHAQELNDRIPDLVAAGCAVACLTALLQRGYRLALAVGGCVVVAAAVSEALKDAAVAVPAQRVLAESSSSWPSSHAAAVAALAGSVALVSARPLARAAVIAVAVAVAVAVVIVTSLSLLVTAAHTPFDLLGGTAIGGASFSAAAWWLSGPG